MSMAITPREWHIVPTQAVSLTIFERYTVAKTQFLRFERNYRGLPTIEWTQANAQIPIIIAGFYLAFVYWGPRLMNNRKAMRLKPLFATWNLLLSLFSFLGASRLLPALASGVMQKGLQHTVCGRPQEWVMDGPAGLWLTLFIFSKIPELIDTAFLVIRKKPVIFLHWYHHFSVMLYCWHALDTTAAPGIWFAAMNFFVHSIMYAYYFATNVGLYKYVRPIAPALTTLQILQMVGGTAILCRCAWTFVQHGQTHCHIAPSNLVAGLGMYLSYFALFALFFAGKYCGPGGGGKQSVGSGKLQLASTSDVKSASNVKTRTQLRSETTATP
jgi:hypothetical protein